MMTPRSYWSSFFQAPLRDWGQRLGVILFCACIGGVSYHLVLQRQFERLSESAQHRIEFYRLSLESMLTRYTSLPRIISLEHRLRALLEAPSAREATDAANHYLHEIRGTGDINAIFLMDATGLTLAASNYKAPGTYIGNNYSFRPYFYHAMHLGQGAFYGVGATTGVPGYFLTAPIEIDQRARGVVAVKISLDDFESALQKSGDHVFLVDSNGIIFLSSIPAWKYHALHPLDDLTREKIKAAKQYHDHDILSLEPPLSPDALPSKARLGLPDSAIEDYLVHSLKTGSLGWQIILLSPTGAEAENALLAGVSASFGSALLFSLFFYFRQSVRRKREHYHAEMKLHETREALEQRILERTADLQATNRSLEERIETLKATEHILRETRDTAVQAGKLTVLGQMAAGISHELNQPLTALHTLTDNAIALLNQALLDDVRDNLGLIKQQAIRMGTITGEIKNFARKSPLTHAAVPLAPVIDQALMLVESRRREVDAKVHTPPIEESLCVLAHPQQLEQVLVNLLLNALDSVRHETLREVSIEIRHDKNDVRLSVVDTGLGISPEVLPYLFDPFFTTKAAGQGLGLGLSISRMIVHELGGDILVYNHAPQGAEFCVVLKKHA